MCSLCHAFLFCSCASVCTSVSKHNIAKSSRDVAVFIRLSSERCLSTMSGENWAHVSTFQAARRQNYLDIIDTVITLIIWHLRKEVKSLRRFKRIEMRVLYLVPLCLLLHMKYCNHVTSERFFMNISYCSILRRSLHLLPTVQDIGIPIF